MSDLEKRLRAAGFRKWNESDKKNDCYGCFDCEFRSLVDPDADDSEDYCSKLDIVYDNEERYTCKYYVVSNYIIGLVNSLGKPPEKPPEKPKSFWQRLFGKR